MPLHFVGAKVSDKLYNMMRENQKNGSTSHTFGALDPVQIVQMNKYLTSVYVSGWQSSSTASTSNEPGPDIADYPYDTVPNKVDGNPAPQPQPPTSLARTSLTTHMTPYPTKWTSCSAPSSSMIASSMRSGAK